MRGGSGRARRAIRPAGRPAPLQSCLRGAPAAPTDWGTAGAAAARTGGQRAAEPAGRHRAAVPADVSAGGWCGRGAQVGSNAWCSTMRAMQAGTLLPGACAHGASELNTLPPHPSFQFVIGPSFTLDGGLAELLTSARVTAERHLLLDGLCTSPLYPDLQRLMLQFETSEGLEAFAALAAGGCFPALRELGLIKGLVENPLPAGLSWDPLSADMRDRVLAQLTSDHEQRVEAGEWQEAFGSEPSSLAEVMDGLLDLTACYPGELSQDLYDAYDELAAAAASGWCLDAARDGWCSFLQQNCEISRADFLLSFPQLTSLRLTNFNTGTEGELVVRLPKLPSLHSLAISTEEQCRGQAGYEPAPGGPTFFEELAVALPSLSSLSIEWARLRPASAAVKCTLEPKCCLSCNPSLPCAYTHEPKLTPAAPGRHAGPDRADHHAALQQ